MLSCPTSAQISDRIRCCLRPSRRTGAIRQRSDIQSSPLGSRRLSASTQPRSVQVDTPNNALNRLLDPLESLRLRSVLALFKAFRQSIGQCRFLIGQRLVFGLAARCSATSVPGSGDEHEGDDDRRPRSPSPPPRPSRPGACAAHPAADHLGGRRRADRQRLALQVELEVFGQLPAVAIRSAARRSVARATIASRSRSKPGSIVAQPGHVLVVDQLGQLPLVLGLGEQAGGGSAAPRASTPSPRTSAAGPTFRLAAASCSGAA